MIVEFTVSPTGLTTTQVIDRQAATCSSVVKLTTQLGTQVGPVEETGPDCPVNNVAFVESQNV